MPAKQVQAVQVGSDSFPILTVQLTEPGTGTALGGTPSEESDIKRPAAFRTSRVDRSAQGRYHIFHPWCFEAIDGRLFE